MDEWYTVLESWSFSVGVQHRRTRWSGGEKADAFNTQIDWIRGTQATLLINTASSSAAGEAPLPKSNVSDKVQSAQRHGTCKVKCTVLQMSAHLKSQCCK
eukprot:scaffold63641_cov21-Tisochrysis_lutea.AAC.1